MDAKAIIVFVIIVAIITGLIMALDAGLNKMSDKARNKRIRAQEAKNPPKEESLADRYK